MTVLNHFVEISDYLHQLVLEDCHFTIADTEKFIVSLPGKKLKMAISVGDSIREGSITAVALKEKERVVRQGNKELYGIAHAAVCTPIFENNSVVGCISIGYSQEKSEKISLMAETLATMIEELNESAPSVSASFQELAATNKGLFSMSGTIREEMTSITKLADFTTKIAHETNIIGLNASIQSAHAGEYGNAFGVVAKEIRKMAERSSESSKIIKNQLLMIQDSVASMLKTIEDANVFTIEQATVSERLSLSITELNEIAQHLSELSKIE